jgi:membrane-associated HD superfamily phosphohydrolase
MDLIELKSAWTLLQQDVISNDKVDEQLIGQSIHQKSQSEITGIKRAMHTKFIVGSVVMLIGLLTTAALIFSADYNPLSRFLDRQEALIFYIIITISLGAMIVVNHYAYKQIDFLTKNPNNIRQALENITLSMRKAMRFNIYSDTFISPIFITWIYYAYAFKSESMGWNILTLILIVLPILFGILSFYLTRYTQHLKFGQYVDRLEGYLDSLQKNSSEL